MKRHLAALARRHTARRHTARLTGSARRAATRLAGSAAAAAGHTVRHARQAAPYLPGWAGAALVSWGAALIYLPAGLITGGVFLLAIDALIPGRPKGGE